MLVLGTGVEGCPIGDRHRTVAAREQIMAPRTSAVRAHGRCTVCSKTAVLQVVRNQGRPIPAGQIRHKGRPLAASKA